jgi:hypothetical protein
MRNLLVAGAVLGAGAVNQPATAAVGGYPVCDVLAAVANVEPDRLPLFDDRTFTTDNEIAFGLNEGVVNALDGLGLAPAELRDLQARYRNRSREPHPISCPGVLTASLQWGSPPPSGKATALFTQPLFSSNGRIAVIGRSLDEWDRGQSELCVVRRGPKRWQVQCKKTLRWAR